MISDRRGSAEAARAGPLSRVGAAGRHLAADAPALGRADGLQTYAAAATGIVFPGFGAEIICNVFNENRQRSALTGIEARVTWPNGQVQSLGGIGSPFQIAPQTGILYYVNFIVPPGIPEGVGVLTCQSEARDGDAFTGAVDSVPILVRIP